MIKRIIILPDIHMRTTVPKPYQLVKRFIKEQKSDEIVLLGDFMDCSALSHWNKDKKRPMEGLRYKKEVALANKELDFLEKHTKKITYLEGNHENWVEQYLDKTPEMEGLIELPKVLKLKERKIKWIKMNDLYKIGKLYATHGMYTNKYHANKHLSTLGANVVYGHIHRPQSDMMNMKMQKPHQATALGCLCSHDPEYMKNRPANWMNGFGIVYLNETTGSFNLYSINIINDRFIWNGKEYK